MKQHSLPLDARKTSALWNELQNIAKYCKYMQIYANMFESLRLLQIGWLHGHRKHQKTLPSAGQRPLQLPARVRSTQKSSPRRFSTRAYKSNCSCSANLRRNMKEPFYEQNWATCLRPTMAYIFKWKEAPCKYKVMMQWYMVQQLVLGSRILENTWLIHIFSTQKWFTDWRLLAPENTDHLISFDHFGMKSKLLLLAYV